VVILRVNKIARVTKGASHTMTQGSYGNYNFYVFNAGNDTITIG
jgi:hypothetical protein